MPQSNDTIKKMNPEAVAYGGRRGGWCDDGQMRAYTRKPGRGRKARKKTSTGEPSVPAHSKETNVGGLTSAPERK